MAITIPKYIEKANIVELPIDYTWEDMEQCEFDVPRLLNKIAELESRSKFALTIGFAEWVQWRISKHYSNPVFFQLLEAAWAGIVDRRYFNHLSSGFGDRITKHIGMPKSSTNIRKHYRGDFDEDCEDLIKGPAIASIVVTVVVADHTYPGGSNAPETVNGSNIAEHVVGNLKAFKAWRRAAIKRLAQHNGIRDSSDKSSRYGSPVPREILDPDFDYKSEAAPELINAFLSQLDYSSNPFLPSPDELKQVGFEGTPYVYGVK